MAVAIVIGDDALKYSFAGAVEQRPVVAGTMVEVVGTVGFC